MLQARDALVSVVSKLVVRRAPSDVVIRQLDTMTSMMGFSSNNDTIDVLENTNVTLECSSVGGQPPPKLYWELPESLPSFSLSETVRNGSAVSVISVLVIRSSVVTTHTQLSVSQCNVPSFYLQFICWSVAIEMWANNNVCVWWQHMMLQVWHG